MVIIRASNAESAAVIAGGVEPYDEEIAGGGAGIRQVGGGVAGVEIDLVDEGTGGVDITVDVEGEAVGDGRGGGTGAVSERFCPNKVAVGVELGDEGIGDARGISG